VRRRANHRCHRRREPTAACPPTTITECTVPEPYTIKWKVLNRGDEAERPYMIRGQIVDSNSNRHHETTDFRGDHYVECYALDEGVVVARERIEVPITTQ
jgi:hypothetical protein